MLLSKDLGFHSSKAKALYLGVKDILPLNNGITLNVRAGISFCDAEIRETDSASPGQIFSTDESGNDIHHSAGAQYDINSQISVGLEYTITNMGVSTESIFTVSADFDVKNNIIGSRLQTLA